MRLSPVSGGGGRIEPSSVGTVGAREGRVWDKIDAFGGGSNLDAQVGEGELVLNLVGWDATQAMGFERWFVSPATGRFE